MGLINMLITVITGVLVFVGGQLFLEFVLRPMQEYKELKGKVAKSLVLHAQFYGNPQFKENGPSENHDCASKALRELASEVAAFSEIMPCYFMTSKVMPKKEKLKEVSSNLIGLSNSLYTDERSAIYCSKFSDNYRKEIENILDILWKHITKKEYCQKMIALSQMKKILPYR